MLISSVVTLYLTRGYFNLVLLALERVSHLFRVFVKVKGGLFMLEYANTLAGYQNSYTIYYVSCMN